MRFTVLWELCVPLLCLCFLQVLDLDLVMLYVYWLITGCGYCQSLYSEILLDASASHVMLCASCGCSLIALDALRIVLDVFCIVCDAWASFDACASCVEPGASWVTKASSFTVFFFFFFYFVAFGIITLLKFAFIWSSLDIT